MNGAESLVHTLADSGIAICFGNPGTSEMHVVAALDREPRIRGVLCLQEGVAAGAADGYARMARKPAATLLHLGPGFANAMSFLHNARKGGQGIVNIVGDHARSHSQYAQAPLTSDIMAICAGVSDWLHRSTTPDAVADDGARAVQAARAGQIATLVLPADCAWEEAGNVAPALPVAAPAPSSTVDQVAAALKTGKNSLLLMRGACLQRAGLESCRPHRTGDRHSAGARLFHAPHHAWRRPSRHRTHSLFRRGDR
jgi:acetolactate synthase-1/2/3 large subunit